MVYDLDRAYKLKKLAQNTINRIAKLAEKEIDKYLFMKLPEWIEIDGHSINIESRQIIIYDRILSERQKRRPTWGYILPRYETVTITVFDECGLSMEDVPWVLKIIKYIRGSYVSQKPEDDPDYILVLTELCDDITDMNKAIKELR